MASGRRSSFLYPRPDSVADAAPWARKPSILANGHREYSIVTGSLLPNKRHKSGIDVRDRIKAINALVEELFPDSSAQQREIYRETVEIALIEASHINSAIPHVSNDLPPPVRDLSPDELQAIKETGKRHSWEKREPNDPRNAMEWVRDYYKEWIPGLLKNYIRQADQKLYVAFMQHICRKGLPDEMDIPTNCENDARKIAARNRTTSAAESARRRVLAAARKRAQRHSPA